MSDKNRLWLLLQYITLKGDKQEVTRLARCPDRRHLAAGYSDGMIRIFDIVTGEATIHFSGHKSMVTALQYDVRGLHLVSGAKVRADNLPN